MGCVNQMKETCYTSCFENVFWIMQTNISRDIVYMRNSVSACNLESTKKKKKKKKKIKN